MNLNEDFKEFLQFLNSNSVRYLVIGGYAVAAHGHVRYTKDIDIWIEQTEANSDRLMRALGEFGFGSIGLSSSDFLEPDTVVQLGYPPRRIDLLTSPSGVTFQRCYENRMTIEIDGTTIPFISLKDLKANKAASGRPRDLADIEDLS